MEGILLRPRELEQDIVLKVSLFNRIYLMFAICIGILHSAIFPVHKCTIYLRSHRKLVAEGEPNFSDPLPLCELLGISRKTSFRGCNWILRLLRKKNEAKQFKDQYELASHIQIVTKFNGFIFVIYLDFKSMEQDKNMEAIGQIDMSSNHTFAPYNSPWLWERYISSLSLSSLFYKMRI